MELEKDIEEKVTQAVANLGGMCLKLRPETGRGFPDRTIILPGGLVLFVEIKRTPKDFPSPHQLAWIDSLRSTGCMVFVVNGETVEEFCRVLDIIVEEQEAWSREFNNE